MSRSLSFGVDVCLSTLGDENTPKCPHGPTVMFERYTKSGCERFYACSANRDRKYCNFVLRVEDFSSQTAEKLRAREIYNDKLQPKLTHGQAFKKMVELKKLPVNERKVCLDCGLILTQEEYHKHIAHNVKDTQLTDSLLAMPTKLLLPLENKKTNAQYLFSEKTSQFIVHTMSRLGYRKILCVGAPRIHEVIQNMSSGLQSMLLDIDHRYEQFYDASKFQRYNMFNHHLFRGDKGQRSLRSFMVQDTGPVVMVTDPPFGGLAELLAFSIGRIECLWRKANDLVDEKLPVIWIFPYYLESKVKAAVKGHTMLDYKVEYENHNAFKNTKGQGHSKLGSAVRMFTNIEPKKVVLPKEEGYRFCKKCERYVYKENQHCVKCDCCTSKDGRRYIHCDKCGRCVKPNKQHCDKCNICDLGTHQCGKVTLQGCHICGSHDHKRRDCPRGNHTKFNNYNHSTKVNEKTLPKKRKLNMNGKSSDIDVMRKKAKKMK